MFLFSWDPSISNDNCLALAVLGDGGGGGGGGVLMSGGGDDSGIL